MLIKDRLDLQNGIYDALEEGTRNVPEGTEVHATLRAPRSHYLGMSSIGKCAAEQWKKYRQPSKGEFPERIQRIFDTGHLLEAMVEEYINASTDLHLVGSQRAYSDIDGKFKGHCDWLVHYLPMDKVLVLDGKTMNDNKWNAFRAGGAKFSHPEYVVQGNMYTGYERERLADADHLIDGYGIVALNKDNSEFHVEVFAFDPAQFDYHKSKAKLILESRECPPCEFVNLRMRFCDCKRRKK